MRHFSRKLLSLLCVLALVFGCVSPGLADENRTDFNPIRLSTLSPYAKGQFQLYWVFMKHDTRDNLYADMLFSSMEPSDGSVYNLYDIGGKYHYLQATVGARRNSNGIREKYTAIVRIYGDDRLLFSDEHITSESKPYEINLDIKNVMDLKIEMYGDGNNGSNGIRAMLGNPVLLKDDPGFFDGAPDAPSPESYSTAKDLAEIPSYRHGEFGLGEETNIKDSRGNEYPFALRGYMLQDDGSAWQVYDIGGEYQFLTATVAPMYMSGGIKEGYTGLIRIYGDGRLLWSDEQIDSATRPYEITVYIGHVMDLKIEIYGNNGGYHDGVNPLLASPKLLR